MSWTHSFLLAGCSSLIVLGAFLATHSLGGGDVVTFTQSHEGWKSLVPFAQNQPAALSDALGVRDTPLESADTTVPPTDTSPREEAEGVRATESFSPPQNAPATPIGETTRFLSNDERDALLALHNAERRKVGVPTLSWAPYLAESAANWANALASRGCTLGHSDGEYGETIFYGRKYGTADLIPWTPEEVMSSFVVEKKYYDAQSASCEAGKECGHYTQIVWSDSARVGCAKSLCESPDEREEVWVCHYDPRGNVAGQSAY